MALLIGGVLLTPPLVDLGVRSVVSSSDCGFIFTCVDAPDIPTYLPT